MIRFPLILCFWLLPLVQSHADPKQFVAEGLSLSLDGDFSHDLEDLFGYVIRSKDSKLRKIRIHTTRHKGLTLLEAAKKTAEHTKKYGDVVTEESIIKTTSGLPVLRTAVTKGHKDIYLERYYCKLPGGDIVCLCVYSYGDTKLSKSIRSDIAKTLSLQPKVDTETKPRADKAAQGNPLPRLESKF